MKHTLYAMMASGLVFGLVSCSDSSTDQTATDTPESSSTEESPAAEPQEMGEVAKQVDGILVAYDAESEDFVEAQLDGSIEYYVVSLSASW